MRLQEAKDYMREQKKSMANINREENQRIKDERTLKRAKEWDTNRVYFSGYRTKFMRFINRRKM